MLSDRVSLQKEKYINMDFQKLCIRFRSMQPQVKAPFPPFI